MDRCYTCKKKLPIMKYTCKCNKIFCIFHLQAEEHKCNYDYKTEEKNKLRKANPEIISSTLEHKM
jgi:hypothetical protein